MSKIKDELIEQQEKLYSYEKPDSQEDIQYQSQDPDFDNKLDSMRMGETNRY
jgi:hypothetical protein